MPASFTDLCIDDLQRTMTQVEVRSGTDFFILTHREYAGIKRRPHYRIARHHDESTGDVYYRHGIVYQQHPLALLYDERWQSITALKNAVSTITGSPAIARSIAVAYINDTYACSVHRDMFNAGHVWGYTVMEDGQEIATGGNFPTRADALKGLNAYLAFEYQQGWRWWHRLLQPFHQQ